MKCVVLYHYFCFTSFPLLVGYISLHISFTCFSSYVIAMTLINHYTIECEEKLHMHCKKFYIKHRMWCLNKNINGFPIQHRTWHLNENHFEWFILHIFLIIWGLIVILNLIKRVWNISAHIHICMHKYFLHSTCQYT